MSEAQRGALPDVRHPVFARVYARLSCFGEEHGLAEHRRELLAASGAA